MYCYIWYDWLNNRCYQSVYHSSLEREGRRAFVSNHWKTDSNRRAWKEMTGSIRWYSSWCLERLQLRYRYNKDTNRRMALLRRQQGCPFCQHSKKLTGGCKHIGGITAIGFITIIRQFLYAVIAVIGEANLTAHLKRIIPVYGIIVIDAAYSVVIIQKHR